VCLGVAYYIALTTESPLAALTLFFVAVLLAIVGTYFLFIAGSIALLKMLRKNKGYYYQPKHFISVSGMIYRMKQNAAGLANICILSTAVIVMISTTVSLYAGMEDVLRTRYPRNITVEAADVSDKQVEKLDAMIAEQAAKAGVSPQNVARFPHMSFVAMQDGAKFTGDPSQSYMTMAANMAAIILIPLDDYNKIENKSASLSDGEALLYVKRGELPGDTVSFGSLRLSIKERLPAFHSGSGMSSMAVNSYYLVVDGRNTIEQVYRSLSGGQSEMEGFSYYYGFDVAGGKEAQINMAAVLFSSLDHRKQSDCLQNY
jgi:putative ABC transport system permease protein